MQYGVMEYGVWVIVTYRDSNPRQVHTNNSTTPRKSLFTEKRAALGGGTPTHDPLQSI